MFNLNQNLFIKKHYPQWFFFLLLGIIAVVTWGVIVWKLDHRLLTLVQPPERVEIGTAAGPSFTPSSSGVERISIAAESRTQAQLDLEEQAFLTLINNYRRANGLSPDLIPSPTLTATADWMSQDMADYNYFSHTDSLGRNPFQRMAAFGYDCAAYNTWCGENLAAGCQTAQACFDVWKNSPGHNGNMLNSNFRVIGIGRAYNASSTYGWYWTTDFGGVVDTQPPIDIDWFQLNGPAPITINDTQGRYLWVIARVRSLVDQDQTANIKLTITNLPSGCSQREQQILPGTETFDLPGNAEKWILYRERYECHGSSRGAYYLNVKFTAGENGGLYDVDETTWPIILQ